MECKTSIDISGLKEVLKMVEEPNIEKARQFMADEVIRLADDYVPMDSGLLKNTVFKTANADEIVYPLPYAHYLWEGYLMVDPITGKGAFYNPETGRFWSRPNTQKVLSDRKLNFAGAPQRGDHWIDNMWEDEGENICHSVESLITRKR